MLYDRALGPIWNLVSISIDNAVWCANIQRECKTARAAV